MADQGTVWPGGLEALGAGLPAFLESAPDAMVIVGPDGVIRLANQQARTLFGYAKGDLVGRPIEELVPERYRRAHPASRQGYSREPRIRPMGASSALHALRKDGSEFPAEISLGPIVTADGVFVTAAIRDISERLRVAEERREARQAIEAADALKANLREREILLQEIHHRVKNNLQVISSLINMQRRTVADEAARTALVECQTRVQAIGLVHEQLYRAGDYARVPFSDYVRTLVTGLQQGLGSERVQVRFDLEPLSLRVDKAIPCGLIVNELVTNAFKHAFPDERPGAISVRLATVDGRIALTVADDGVGLHPSGDAADRSVGQTLVRTLVEQVHGALEVTESPGTSYTLSFPQESP
ncbi:MAG: histidine kinase dimerization/phosphoacceptor domain -containing protein [Vicinamibacterales bacterium]